MISYEQMRMDEHKLHFHPSRVADWLMGKDIPPIYAEVALSSACNHRCRFCCVDFLGYKSHFMPEDIWIKRLSEFSEIGLKSILYAGEGEPLTHKKAADIVISTREAGIDPAVLTNGVYLRGEAARRIISAASWIRISLNAGSATSYAQIHRTAESDYLEVLSNIEQAVKIRREENADCVLGAQMVLLPNNMHETVSLARLLRELGLDYLVIKPYIKDINGRRADFDGLIYGDYSELNESLSELNTTNFRTIFRHAAIQSRDGLRPQRYKKCFGLPFMLYVDAQAELWSCCHRISHKNFRCGSFIDQSVTDLVFGRQRRRIMTHAAKDLDVSICSLGCRLDNINAYLWELKHPGPHVNFI